MSVTYTHYPVSVSHVEFMLLICAVILEANINLLFSHSTLLVFPYLSDMRHPSCHPQEP